MLQLYSKALEVEKVGYIDNVYETWKHLMYFCN